MKFFILNIFVFYILSTAFCQSTILNPNEIDLIKSITKNNQSKINYFVFIDKNDCFNCTIASSLLKQELDSSRVYILSNQIEKNELDDYINFYQLSNSFNYVFREEIFKIFIKKAEQLFKDKSFIAEVNSSIVTIIPLKKFNSQMSFGDKIDISKEKVVFNKGHFITAITKFASYEKDFIAFSSPKSLLHYFSSDSIRSNIYLDSNILKLAYNYIIMQQHDSIKLKNSFTKSIEVYNKQLLKYGFTLFSAQNFTISDNKCIALLQVSMPISTSSTNIVLEKELFLAIINLNKSNYWNISKFTPIDNSNLPKGKVIFAYNFFSYNPIDETFEVGFYQDSNLIKNINYNQMHCTYKILNGVYSSTTKCMKSYPSDVITNYTTLQNIALIHYSAENNKVKFTYLPIIVNSDTNIILPLNLTKDDLYHSFASVSIENKFLDFCSINGVYYFIIYKVANNKYIIESINKKEIKGTIQSVEKVNDSFNYIRYENGYFYKNNISNKF
ncbi:MAG: hypothetical protein IT243_02395 [Bacteroidia bacterium]|nr:hypothetical protein [Bacteroidia bacterium]